MGEEGCRVPVGKDASELEELNGEPEISGAERGRLMRGLHVCWVALGRTSVLLCCHDSLDFVVMTA